MKEKIIIIFTLANLLTGCGLNTFTPSTLIANDCLVQENEIITDFKNGDHSSFKKSTWPNPYPFNCRFSRDNVQFSNGAMQLTLNKEGDTYFSGEYASLTKFLMVILQQTSNPQSVQALYHRFLFIMLILGMKSILNF